MYFNAISGKLLLINECPQLSFFFGLFSERYPCDSQFYVYCLI
jgi:hypothetical protein